MAVQFVNNPKVGDNVKIEVGNSADLTIFHDGNSIIRNTVGDLYIDNYADDKDIIFRSDDGLGSQTAYIIIDGSTGENVFYKNVALRDSVKATFGNSNDLQIYHDGSKTTLQNFTGSFDIIQQADDGNIIFSNDDGNGGLFDYFVIDGGSATYSGGATTAAFTVWQDKSRIALGSGKDLQIYHDGTDSFINNDGTGDLYIQQFNNDKDIIFKSDNGSGGLDTYITIDGDDRITKFAKNTSHADNVKALFGTSFDLQIYHDASNSFIQDSGTGDLYVLANNLRLANADNSGQFINANNGGAVEIFHNNSKKFETTANGVNIVDSELGIGAGHATASPGNAVIFAPYGAGTNIAGGEIQIYSGRSTGNAAGGSIKFYISPTGSSGSAANAHAQVLLLDSGKNATFAGNVGIGSFPTSRLQIEQSILPRITMIKTGVLSWYVGNPTQGSSGNFTIGTDSGSNLDILTLDTSANATFAGDIKFVGDGLISSNTADGSDNAQIVISGGGASGDTRGASVHISGNESGNAGLLQLRAGSGSVSEIRSYTDGSERIRVNSSGNVGIGTTSPTTARLVVNGAQNTYTLRLNADETTGQSYGLRVRAGTNSSDKALFVENATAASELFSIKGDGNATFGGAVTITNSSAPVLRLTNTTGSQSWIQYVGSNDDFIIRDETDSRTTLLIDGSGNIGIGTTSPTKKLTISDNSAQVLLIDTSSSNTLEVEVGDEIASFKLDKDGAAENSKFVWSIDDASRMELTIAEGDQSQLKLNNYGSGNITGTAAYTLQVDSNGNVIEGSTSGGGTVTGTGTATRVAFWSGTSALSSDANLYWDNTNNRLGIGTNNPFDRLTVDGDIRLLSGNKLILNRANNGTRSEINTDTTGKIILNSINSEGIAVQNAGSTVLTVNNSGNVGIGTTAPSTGLTVTDGATPYANSNYLVQIKRNSSNGNDNTSKAAILLCNNSNAMQIAYGGTTDRLRIIDGSGVERFTLLNGGNVGIGTTSPTSKLSLSGSQTALDLTRGTTGDSKWGLSSDSTALYIAELSTGSTDYIMTFKETSGNVGIGTTSPTGKLEVQRSQVTTQFDRDCFLRLHPTATTDEGGFTNIFFGTSTTNNFGVAVGGRKGGAGDTSSTNNPEFSVRILNDAITGTEVLNINTAGNATFAGNVTANGNYSAGQSAIIYKAQRSGGAVASDWSYDDATTDMSLGTSTSHSFSLKTGNTRALTIDSSQNSTFAGDVGLADNKKLKFGAGPDLEIYHNSTTNVNHISSLLSRQLSINADATTFSGDVNVQDNLYLQDGSTVRAKIQLNASDRDDLDIIAASLGSKMKFFTVGAERMRIDSAGNLGLGTTLPTNGGGNGSWLSLNAVTGSAYSGGIAYTIANAVKAYHYVESGYLRHQAQSGVGHRFTVNGTTDAMYMTSAGKVGIGTTNAQAKLDVQGQIRSTSNIVSNSGYDAFYIGSSRTINDYGGLYKNYFTMKLQTPAGAHAYGDLRFQLANSPSTTAEIDVMTLSYTGNVGIGTTAPTQKLTVGGGGAILQEGPTGGGNNTFQTWQYGTDTNYKLLLKQNVGSGIVKHIFDVTNNGTAYANNLVIDRGKIGIGTASPSSLLHLSDASSPTIRIVDTTNSVTLLAFAQDSSAGFGTYSNHTLAFFSNSAERMRISTGGNVGIGTTSPAHKLSVNGTFKYGSGLEQSGAVSSGEPANPPEFTPEAWLDIKVNGSDYLIPLFEKSS